MLGRAQNPPRQVQAVWESPKDYLTIISPAMFAQDGWNASQSICTFSGLAQLM